NRGYLNVLPYASQRGNPFYAYPVTGSGRNATIASFDGFDARFGPLLDGRVGKYGTAPPVFGLAFNLNYPYRAQADPAAQFNWRPFKDAVPDRPGQEPALRDVEDTWRAVGQQTLAHVAQRGWTNTAFEVFNNQKPATNNTSPWNLDEPVHAREVGLRWRRRERRADHHPPRHRALGVRPDAHARRAANGLLQSQGLQQRTSGGPAPSCRRSLGGRPR